MAVRLDQLFYFITTLKKLQFIDLKFIVISLSCPNKLGSTSFTNQHAAHY
jgi:hypothetical protein